MKKSLFLAFYLLFLNGFAQELVKKNTFGIQKNSDVFYVENTSNNTMNMFFVDKENVHAHQLDENLNPIDSLTCVKPPKKFSEIIGYSVVGNTYYSYWSDGRDKEFFSLSFNFETKQTNSSVLKFSFKKEDPIKKITINDVFYIITIVENTNIMNFYAINQGKIEKHIVDLSKARFLTSENSLDNLWRVYREELPFDAKFSTQTISNNTPPSLVLSAQKRKTYVRDNSIVFTLDNTNTCTQFLEVNLKDYTYTGAVLNQPNIPNDGYFKPGSNSFLIEDKLVQIKSDNQKLFLNVKNISGETIKSFEIKKDEPISFNSSEIIQENGSVSSTRVLDKSNQLLRKIDNLYPSLSCYSDKGFIYMTLGGVSLEKGNNAMIYGAMLGGVGGALIGALISSSSSAENVNSYKDRKIVYISSKFDQDFNSIDEPIKKLPFDKLRVFDAEHPYLSIVSVFKFNSILYFGGYDRKLKSYSFYSFTD